MAVPPTTKLAVFYGHTDQNAAGVANSYTPADLSNRASWLIEGSRTTLSNSTAYRTAGFTGLILLYVIGCAQDPTTGSLFGNQMVMTASDFTSLPSTAFLYTSSARTTRLTWTQTGGRICYRLDPASSAVRQLYVRTMTTSLNSNPQIDGIFVDNIGEILNMDNDGPVWPGSSSVAGDGTTANTAYTTTGFATQELAMFQYVRDNITSADFVGTSRTTFVMAGNMLYRHSQSAWTQYTMFNGLMYEAVVGYTNSGNFDSAASIDTTLTGATAWLAIANKFLLVVHQVPTSVTAAQNRYGQAAMLMTVPTTNSMTLAGRTFPRVTYRPASAGAYKRWFEFSDFDLNLGNPSGVYTKSGDLYSRTFATGTVRLNTSTGTLSGLTGRSGEITETVGAPGTSVPVAVTGSSISVRGDAVTLLPFTIPSVCQLNDEYDVWVGVRNTAETTVTVTIAGFTAVTNATINQGGSGAVRLFRRTLSWDDPGKEYTVTLSSANDVLAIGEASRGVDFTTPIDVSSAATNNVTLDTATIPSITTTGTNRRLLAVVAWPATDKVIGTPTSMNSTKRAESGGGTAIVLTAALFDQNFPTAGATGSKTSVITPAQGVNTRHFTSIIALTPAAGAAPAAPTNLLATPDANAGQIVLTYSLPAGTLTEQVLQESVDGGAFAVVTPAPGATDTGITLTRLPASYAYRVAVKTVNGWSPFSASANAALGAPTPASVPAPVSALPVTRLWIGLDLPTGTLDVSGTATALQWEDDAHGPRTARATLRGRDAITALSAWGQGGSTLRATNATNTIWRGEIDEMTVAEDGVTVEAQGPWSALSLVPYTEFWSSSTPEDWELLPAYGYVGPIGPLQGDWFDVGVAPESQLGGLRFRPVFDQVYDTTSVYGMGFIQVPYAESITRRGLQQIQVSITISRQYSSHVFQLTLYRIASSTLIPIWQESTASAGAGGTGLVGISTVSYSGPIAIPAGTTSLYWIIRCSSQNGSGYATGESFRGNSPGDGFQLTAVRVLSTTAPTVTPDQVIADIITHTNLYNPGSLSTSTAAITAVPYDLPDLRYEDADAASILEDLAALGNPPADPNSTDAPTPLEVGCSPAGIIFFRPVLQAHTYDAASQRMVREVHLTGPPVEARYSLRELVNAAYGISEAGARFRADDDTTSIARYGRTRMRSASITNISRYLADAARLIDAYSTPPPMIEIIIDGGDRQLADRFGAPVPLWDVRRGDWLRIPAPKVGPLPDATRQFYVRIIATSYDAVTNQLTLTLEQSPPRLDVQLAALLARR